MNNEQSTIEEQNKIIRLIEIEIQSAKERIKLIKESFEIEKSAYKNLEKSKNNLEKSFGITNDTGCLGNMTIAESAKKILCSGAVLTTREICNIIKENGKIWHSKSPFNSVSSVLHYESKKKNSSIVHVGTGKWRLKQAWDDTLD